MVWAVGWRLLVVLGCKGGGCCPIELEGKGRWVIHKERDFLGSFEGRIVVGSWERRGYLLDWDIVQALKQKKIH
jgi:hypothetical protein